MQPEVNNELQFGYDLKYEFKERRGSQIGLMKVSEI